MIPREKALHFVRWHVAFVSGFGWGGVWFTGNWWWMLVWLIMPIGAIAEVVIQKSQVLFR